jgi:predicted TIM-barrel enzyme
MNDIIRDIIKNQSVIAKLHEEFGEADDIYEMLWTAVNENNKDQSFLMLDMFTLNLNEKAYEQKATNGLNDLLALTETKNQMQEDIIRGKRKVSSLADIMGNDPIEKIKKEVKQIKKPTNILDL